MNALTIQRTLQLWQHIPNPPASAGYSRVAVVSSVVLMSLTLAGRLASQAKLKTIVSWSVAAATITLGLYYGQRETISHVWDRLFGVSKEELENDLTRQFPAHQLRGELLRRFCLLNSGNSLKLALPEMNFAQLSEVRTVIGKERFGELLQKLPQKKVPHQLWLGIHEFVAADYGKKVMLVENQLNFAACDWFREYTRALAKEISREDVLILNRLKEIAPHLKTVHPYATFDEGTPADIAAAHRVAKHCQSLPLRESLDEWIADLKFAAARKDPAALRKVEDGFDQLSVPRTFENLQKIVQGYINAKHTSTLLDEFKTELVKLYKEQEALVTYYIWEWEKIYTNHYRFACQYECAEYREEICQQIINHHTQTLKETTELLILLGENETFESLSRMLHKFTLPWPSFRAIYAHFIQRDTPKALRVVTWMTDSYKLNPEANQLKLYAPHETPVGLRPQVNGA